jgi:hypothetical protein
MNQCSATPEHPRNPYPKKEQAVEMNSPLAAAVAHAIAFMFAFLIGSKVVRRNDD